MSTSTSIEARLALLACLAACEPPQDHRTYTHPFANFCDASDVAPCDVRERACVDRVFAYTACLREMTAPPDIPVSVVPAAELERASTSTTTQRLYEALALIGLMPPGVELPDATGETTFLGFYDPATRGITVVDHGRGLDSAEAVEIMAHEAVHAMQDREHDLAATLRRHGTDHDRFLAIDAVVEGEAVLYADLFTRALERRSYWEDGPPFGGGAGIYRTAMSSAPFLDASGDVVYGEGARFVAGTWERGGQPAIAALFDAPPLSTEEVLSVRTSTRSLVPRRFPSRLTVGSTLAVYRQANEIVLGGYMLRVFVFRHELRVKATWAGDRFFAFEGPAAAFVWLIATGAPEAATELAGALRAATPPAGARWTAAARGDTVVFAGALYWATVDDWLAAGLAALPP